MLPSGSAGLLAPSPPPPAPRGEHFASGVLGNRNRRKLRREILGPLRDLHRHLARHALVQTGDLAVGVAHHRSEERRVGKEGRSRRAWEQRKKECDEWE